MKRGSFFFFLSSFRVYICLSFGKETALVPATRMAFLGMFRVLYKLSNIISVIIAQGTECWKRIREKELKLSKPGKQKAGRLRGCRQRMQGHILRYWKLYRRKKLCELLFVGKVEGRGGDLISASVANHCG